MKDIVISMWKWIVVGVLLAAIGIFLVTGLGRRRGTRSYRWRMALWTLSLALLSGGVMVSQGCSVGSEKMDNDSVSPMDLDNEDSSQDAMIMCYDDIQIAPDIKPDEMIMCYKAMPDIQDAKPDQMIMCYEAMPDDIMDDKDVPMATCYKMVPDASE